LSLIDLPFFISVVVVVVVVIAAVDPHTDELIQRVLRGDAATNGTTVLTIAHRLQTIADYDRILVLKDGTAIEFDSPAALRANPDSLFCQMMRDAGH
jgi:ATP-binding cassette, subfamily C (CFTR/MRP), member 1